MVFVKKDVSQISREMNRERMNVGVEVDQVYES
jgi:hypothetical protein